MCNYTNTNYLYEGFKHFIYDDVTTQLRFDKEIYEYEVNGTDVLFAL